MLLWVSTGEKGQCINEVNKQLLPSPARMCAFSVLAAFFFPRARFVLAVFSVSKKESPPTILLANGGCCPQLSC